MANAQTLFLSSEVVSITTATSVSEALALSVFVVPEPSDELATTASRILGMQTAIGWEVWGCSRRESTDFDFLGKNNRRSKSACRWLSGSSSCCRSSGDALSGGSGSSSGGNNNLFRGLVKFRSRKVLGDLCNTASSLAILDSGEVVVVAFTTSVEEILAFLKVLVVVESEFVAITRSSFLGKVASFGRNSGMQTSDKGLLGIRTADRALLDNRALVASRTLGFSAIDDLALRGLQGLESKMTFSRFLSWKTSSLTSSFCRIVVSVSTASRVGELSASLGFFVVEPSLNIICARTRFRTSSAFVSSLGRSRDDLLTIWLLTLDSAVVDFDTFGVDTEAF